MQWRREQGQKGRKGGKEKKKRRRRKEVGEEEGGLLCLYHVLHPCMCVCVCQIGSMTTTMFEQQTDQFTASTMRPSALR